jgi:hypothetical protein
MSTNKNKDRPLYSATDEQARTEIRNATGLNYGGLLLGNTSLLSRDNYYVDGLGKWYCPKTDDITWGGGDTADSTLELVDWKTNRDKVENLSTILDDVTVYDAGLHTGFDFRPYKTIEFTIETRGIIIVRRDSSGDWVNSGGLFGSGTSQLISGVNFLSINIDEISFTLIRNFGIYGNVTGIKGFAI